MVRRCSKCGGKTRSETLYVPVGGTAGWMLDKRTGKHILIGGVICRKCQQRKWEFEVGDGATNAAITAEENA